MRRLLESDPSWPPTLLVHPASADDGREFFEAFWPEARAVSDPQGRLYEALGLQRASLRQLLGPGVWLKALRAMREGHPVGLPVGNPWLMPGLFLVLGEEVLWQWEFANIGDHPDWTRIPEIAVEAAAK